MYDASILERLNHLDYAGIVTGADAVGQVGSITSGSLMKLYLRIVNGVITEAKFKAFGGVFVLVACDILCEFLTNATIETALTIKSDDIISALPGLPEDKLYMAVLAQSLVSDAFDDYYKKLAKAKLNEKK